MAGWRTPINAVRNIARRSLNCWRHENGNATIEFVIIFPALITIFLMVFETGLLMIRGVMLDRAVDISMRELRLGTLSPMTPDALKARICDNTVVIPDCGNVVLVELRPIQTPAWLPPSGAATCVDRDEDIQPVLEFEAGIQNELMMVRVCAVLDPFFPGTGLAAGMQLDATGAYSLVTMSAYVNEP